MINIVDGKHPFQIALAYVWGFPTPTSNVNAQQQGEAMSWIPLAAVLFGLLLASVAFVISMFLPAEVTAGLVMLVWVFFSGQITLNSLARVSDAAVGTESNATLRQNMQDLTIQPLSTIGIVLLVLILILKWALLVRVIEESWWSVFVLMPVVGWSFGQMMMLGTRWVTQTMFKDGWRNHVNLSWLWPQWLLLMTSLALASGWTLTLLIIGTWAWIVWWRKHLGGINAAIAYTWVEVSEVIWLLGLVMVLSSL